MHISLQPIHNSQIHDAVATLLQIPVTTSRQPRGSMRPIYAVTVHRKPRGRSMVGQLGHGLTKNLAGTTMYTVSQKTRHQTLGHNFTNYYPIFNFFSLSDSVVNLQQTCV